MDMERYRNLPDDQRRQVNDWLEAEGLIDQYVIAYEPAGESGQVVITCHALDERGRLYADGDDIAVSEPRAVPVSSPPPLW